MDGSCKIVDHLRSSRRSWCTRSRPPAKQPFLIRPIALFPTTVQSAEVRRARSLEYLVRPAPDHHRRLLAGVCHPSLACPRRQRRWRGHQQAAPHPVRRRDETGGTCGGLIAEEGVAGAVR